MKPMVWAFQNEGEQRMWFRGRVREYHGAQYKDHSCAEVRSNRAAAMKDAKKLMAELKIYN